MRLISAPRNLLISLTVIRPLETRGLRSFEGPESRMSFERRANLHGVLCNNEAAYLIQQLFDVWISYCEGFELRRRFLKVRAICANDADTSRNDYGGLPKRQHSGIARVRRV